MPEEFNANQASQPQERRHHRHDPSEGGWDPSILRAPDSHKAGSRKRRRRRRQLSLGAKILRGIGIVLGCIVLVAAAVGLGLLIALRITGTL